MSVVVNGGRLEVRRTVFMAEKLDRLYCNAALIRRKMTSTPIAKDLGSSVYAVG